MIIAQTEPRGPVLYKGDKSFNDAARPLEDGAAEDGWGAFGLRSALEHWSFGTDARQSGELSAKISPLHNSVQRIYEGHDIIFILHRDNVNSLGVPSFSLCLYGAFGAFRGIATSNVSK